jgi:hypothetical protein
LHASRVYPGVGVPLPFTPAYLLLQVSLPGHICAVVVTTLVLEGWSNKLDPDHSVLSQVGVAYIRLA